jgi:triosephosphate isomerase
MSKKFYLGTNWKMHMTNREARQYISDLTHLLEREHDLPFTLFVIPSFPALQLVREVIDASNVEIKLGAQNAHWESADESTGEISVRILKDLPVDLIEIGHSERRRKFGETDETVNRKVLATIGEGLQALLCIGEEREEKRRDNGRSTLKRQIVDGLKNVSIDDADKLVLAYEPVWAIGPNGEPATEEYVAEQHAYIRTLLVSRFGEKVAQSIPVIYGGSVNHDNCLAYARLDHVDGLFVGRTAWDAASFVKMIRNLREGLLKS